jgi:hypothetical protein
MNNPEYILTDEMATIVENTRVALGLPVLNYEYDYVEKLNEKLKQMEASPASYQGKFPLVWLAEPFTINRGISGIFGKTKLDLFIFNSTEKTISAEDRMTNNYKPILLPIYRELMKQINLSVVFTTGAVELITHSLTKGYYWDDARGKSVLNDAVDCLKIGGAELSINDKENCSPISNF